MSPGWHLADGFTGFELVRNIATGNGVRIAHLDTGYWPPHDSTPRYIRRDFVYRAVGRSFLEQRHGAGHGLRPGPSGDPANNNPANKCDVVTISHGGPTSESWADAVNNRYDACIVIVAASGDNFSELPTYIVVYPSAFNQVVTAVGATYDKRPHVTSKIGELQGNWGPDDVMKKATAVYTPSVAWMMFPTNDGLT